MRVLPVVLVLGLLLRCAAAQDAAGARDGQPQTPQIDRVVIGGNQRVEEEAIRVQLRAQAGTRLNEDTVDSDIRALYRMGFFENVEANLSEENGQWVLTYHVTERPLIHEVRVEGNKKLSRNDLDAAFKVRPNTIFEPDKVRRGIEDAKAQYEKKGYLDATIEYSTAPVGENEVILTYKVDEGKVVRITNLIFEGARAFKPSELKKAMQTKEKWLFSFITGAGNLDNEVLKTDMERLTAFYYDHGYIDVKIDEPKVERRTEGLSVTIKIEEGDQYKVGKIDIAGELLPDMKAARAKVSLTSGDIFRTGKLRDDITALTEVYGDQGYAFVNVTPDTAVNPAEKTVDVTYKVGKGPEVTIDKIEITGNT